MISDILLLIVGLAMVVLGSDFLVDGSSSIARKAGISEFVIGLTIVGFGTSMPELVVSLTGALEGVSDISIGNVVGSNIFNVLLILGLTAVLRPIPVTDTNRKVDIPLTLFVSLLLVLLGKKYSIFGIGTDGLSRIEGILFLVLFAAYMIYCFRSNQGADDESNDKIYKIPAAIFLTLIGLAGLIFGGRLFVDNAQTLAKALGVSDKFIAITILAGGTSLPELATCVVAAAKKKGQLALGNILGSNIFNILLILGCSASVTPLSFGGMDVVDLGALVASAALVLIGAYSFNRNRLDRVEGAFMLLCFVAYYLWLFYKI